MMREMRRTVAVYALGHFLVDFACAFLFARAVLPSPYPVVGALVYNFCAFALQMPLGLAADRLGGGRFFAAAGCILTACAYAVSEAPIAVCVTAGVGNALYHVGGGLDTLNLSKGRSGPLGLFVSPGALGLFCGGLLAREALPLALPGCALLIAALGVLLLCRSPACAPFTLGLDRGAVWAALALFFVVVLRSYMGFLFSFPWKAGAWAWLFTVGVVMGKALGGVCSDKFGAERTAAASLGLCAFLFLLSDAPVCGVAAVLLFNMTMPITLRAAADIFPGAKGFSFGLLTFALFLGFLPELLGLPGVGAGWMYGLLAAVSLALVLLGLRRRRA